MNNNNSANNDMSNEALVDNLPESENPGDDAFYDEIRNLMNDPAYNEGLALSLLAVTGNDPGGRPVSLEMNGSVLEVSVLPTNASAPPDGNGTVVTPRFVEISEFGSAGYAEVKNVISVLDDRALLHFMDAFEENYRPYIYATAISEHMFEEMLKRHPRPRPGHRHQRQLRANFIAFDREYDFNRSFKDHVAGASFTGIPEANIRMLKTLTGNLIDNDTKEYQNWVEIVTGGNTF